MSSQLDSATLTVRIVEELTINGRNAGSKNSHIVGGISKTFNRVLSVPTTAVTALTVSSDEGGSQFDAGSLKYLRLTNLDDQNFVSLNFQSSGGVKAQFKLDPSRSMIFTNTAISGTSTGESFGSFSSFSTLSVTADTAPVDIEIFAAGI